MKYSLVYLALLSLLLHQVLTFQIRLFKNYNLLKNSHLSSTKSKKDDFDALIADSADEGGASYLFVSDVAKFGINTVLAEEHVAMGNYARAEELAIKARQIAKHTGEENNIYAAYAEGIQADALYHIGYYKEAADHYAHALKIYERHSRSSRGPEAVELVGATQLVAWSLLSQKKYKEAVGACSAALVMTETLLGPYAPDVAASLVNLATAYTHSGNIGNEVESLYQRALNIYESALTKPLDDKLKEEYENSLWAIDSAMGNLYYLREDDEHAERCYWKVVNAFLAEKYTSNDAAAPLKNLGLLLWKKGDRANAELMFSRAVYVYQKSPDHKNDKNFAKLVELLDKLRSGESASSIRLKRNVEY